MNGEVKTEWQNKFFKAKTASNEILIALNDNGIITMKSLTPLLAVRL